MKRPAIGPEAIPYGTAIGGTGPASKFATELQAPRVPNCNLPNREPRPARLFFIRLRFPVSAGLLPSPALKLGVARLQQQIANLFNFRSSNGATCHPSMESDLCACTNIGLSTTGL